MSGYSSVDDISITKEAKIVKKKKVIKKLTFAKFYTGTGYQRDSTKFQSGASYQLNSSKPYSETSFSRGLPHFAAVSYAESAGKAQSGEKPTLFYTDIL